MCTCNESLSSTASATMYAMCRRSNIKLDNHNLVIARFAHTKKKKKKLCLKSKIFSEFGFPSWFPTLVLTKLDLALQIGKDSVLSCAPSEFGYTDPCSCTT